MEYHGKALYESLILCDFLEDAYPEHTPHLLPKDPFTKAYVKLWVDHISKAVVSAFFRLLQAQEKEKQDAALDEFIGALRTVSSKRKGDGPFFLGNEFSLADAAIAPWAVRDYIIKEHRGYRREDVGDGWKEWAEALENRESIKNTSSVGASLIVIINLHLRLINH